MTLEDSDVDWVVRQSRVLTDDNQIYEAKSLLLTAKYLFPDNLAILLEMYKVSKNEKKINEASSILQNMLQKFKEDEEILAEVDQLLRVGLKEDDGCVDVRDKFLCDFYKNLSNSLRATLIVQLLSNKINKVISSQEEMDLVVMLFNKCLLLNPQQTDTIFLKLLNSCASPSSNALLISAMVSRLIPHYFSHNNQPPSSIITTCFLLSLRHHLAKININAESNIADETNMASQLKDSSVRGYAAALGGVKELLALLAKVAPSAITVVNSNNRTLSNWGTETQWAYVLSFFHALLFHLSSTSNKKSSSVICLLEASLLAADEMVHDLRAKKAKMDVSLENKNKNNKNNDNDNQESFIKAVEYHNIITKTPSLNQVLLEVQKDGWVDQRWWKSFLIDSAVYQNKYTVALGLLEGNHKNENKNNNNNTNKPINNNNNDDTAYELQKFVCLYRTKSAETFIKDLLKQLGNQSEGRIEDYMAFSAQSCSTFPSCNREDIQSKFFSATNPNAFVYLIDLLIGCLYKLWKQQPNHTSIQLITGHMIVLLQYDWLAYKELFIELLNFIKKKSSFNYPLFTSYVINITVLEEVYNLHNNHKHISLHILPPSSPKHNISRTVTRGVNRYARDDVRSAICDQVKLSDSDIFSLLGKFVVENEKQIIQLFS